MTNEKYEIETKTLKSFFEVYCQNKHNHQEIKIVELNYKNKNYNLELDLCKVCHDSISYSFDRLQNCPYDIKPRCRTCKTPCYEKSRWKNIAKVMMYSALKLSLSKIKRRVGKIFK